LIVNLQESIPVAADFFNLEESVVIKDLQVVRAIHAICSVDATPFRLVFAGGTALARAHKIIRRMSEDVDFKVVPLTNDPISKTELRKQLRGLRERVTAALSENGFDANANYRSRNENQYTVWNLPYTNSNATEQVLRPEIKIEFTYNAHLRLPTVPQGGRYHTNGGDFNFEDLFRGFSGRAGGAGFARQPPNDIHYSIEVDFLEAARGTKKRVTMPDGKTLDINIPEGIEEDQQLRLKGQGSQPSGDAYVEIHIRAHPFFTRKGKDITIELPISLQESVLGAKIQVPTIHGAVEMSIPKGASSGATLRLKGKGIKGGNQFVKLKLVMPKEIDAELEESIRKWSQTHAYNPRIAMEKVL